MIFNFQISIVVTCNVIGILVENIYVYNHWDLIVICIIGKSQFGDKYRVVLYTKLKFGIYCSTTMKITREHMFLTLLKDQKHVDNANQAL